MRHDFENASMESLEGRRLLAAQLLTEFDGLGDFHPADPLAITALRDDVFFAANDGVNGTELWKSDGTAAGTVMVKDIFAGDASSYPSFLFVFKGELFFTANSGQRYELWKSDGTGSGTVMVADVDAGNFTEINGVLFFSGWDAEHGSELWKSDGTSAGTQLVKDIIPGRITRVEERYDPDTGTDYLHYFDGGPYSSAPSDLTNLNGVLYFAAEDGAVNFPRESADGEFNRELWKSDGTAGGTVRVKDIVAGDSSSDPRDFTVVGSTLYFTARDADGGDEIWKSNGSPAGTVRVKDDLLTDFYGSPLLTSHDGTLFFIEHGEDSASHLWKASGGGAVLVKQLLGPGSAGEVTEMVSMGDHLFINAGGDLWVSDGTTAGTTIVSSDGVANLARVGGELYFTQHMGSGEHELKRTDGTAAGTVKISTISTADFPPVNLTNAGGSLFVASGDLINGQKLWLFPTVVRAVFSASVLSVSGTEAADTIVLSVSGSNLQVRHDGEVIESAPLAEVSRIDVSAFGGDDVIDCSAVSVAASIDGEEGDDRISGSTVADTVDAAGGNDFVWANDGNDKIAGGDGDDTLSGGAQKDTIDGGLGNDRLNGNGGHDRLYGYAGADRLYGYDGNDWLDGGSSNDRLEGGWGDDTIFGQGGDDRFFDAQGTPDTLYGGSGRDTSQDDSIDLVEGIEARTSNIIG